MRDPDLGLVRALGTFMLSCAVINVIVGGGIFRLPAQVSGNLGAASPLAFVAGALIIIPVTLCFAAAGSRVGATGGPYSYLREAFGPLAGFLSGALMWICNVASSAGIAAGLADQAGVIVPQLQGTGPRVALLVAVYALVIALNAWGVQIGGRALVVLATLKLTPLILLAGIGAFFIDWGQIQLGALPGFAVLGTSMVAVMFAYSGVETALIPSGEVRDPARTVPRAAFAATLVVVLLYIGLQIVCQATLGADLPASKTPIASTAGALWAPGFGLIMITATLSMLGFLMGNLLGSSRLLYALGRDRYLPQKLAQLSSRKVPLFAILTHGLLALALSCAGNFEFLILVSGGANCLVYLSVAVAAWQLEKRSVRQAQGAPFALPGGVVTPFLTVLSMLAVLSTLKYGEWAAITVAMLILAGIYALLRWLRPPTPSAP